MYETFPLLAMKCKKNNNTNLTTLKNFLMFSVFIAFVLIWKSTYFKSMGGEFDFFLRSMNIEQYVPCNFHAVHTFEIYQFGCWNFNSLRVAKNTQKWKHTPIPLHQFHLYFVVDIITVKKSAACFIHGTTVTCHYEENFRFEIHMINIAYTYKRQPERGCQDEKRYDVDLIEKSSLKWIKSRSLGSISSRTMIVTHIF